MISANCTTNAACLSANRLSKSPSLSVFAANSPAVFSINAACSPANANSWAISAVLSRFYLRTVLVLFLKRLTASLQLQAFRGRIIDRTGEALFSHTNTNKDSHSGLASNDIDIRSWPLNQDFGCAWRPIGSIHQWRLSRTIVGIGIRASLQK
jgi:hypothetical protein